MQKTKAQLYEEWKRKRDQERVEKLSSEQQFEPLPEPPPLPPHLEEQRQRNRAKYPEIAAFVDEVRKVFPDAQVISIRPVAGNETRGCLDPDSVLVPASPSLDAEDEPDDPQ